MIMSLVADSNLMTIGLAFVSLYPDISLFDYSSSIRDLESLRLSTSIVDYEIITKTALDLRNILFAFIHNLRIPSSSHNICRGKEPNSFNG